MLQPTYHIGLTRAQGARYAILPGDPGRVETIAQALDRPEYLGSHREYTAWRGEVDGEPVLVMSTGMGGPSTAIAVEELKQIGTECLIRLGTCGGMQLEVRAGDLIIAQAAIRMEGTSKEYLPVEYPAAADFTLTGALAEAARTLALPYHIGVVQSKDSFYGQHDPGRMPVGPELTAKWNAWKMGGCLASEMECAALFTVAAVLRMRAAAVLLTVWNQERANAGLPDEHDFDTDRAIRAAVEAIRIDRRRV